MGISLVIAAQQGSEGELESMGFKKTEVWLKTSGMTKDEAEREMFRMTQPPFMFVGTESWWGAGPD